MSSRKPRQFGTPMDYWTLSFRTSMQVFEAQIAAAAQVWAMTGGGAQSKGTGAGARPKEPAGSATKPAALAARAALSAPCGASPAPKATQVPFQKGAPRA